jgi:hypothetical protein
VVESLNRSRRLNIVTDAEVVGQLCRTRRGYPPFEGKSSCPFVIRRLPVAGAPRAQFPDVINAPVEVTIVSIGGPSGVVQEYARSI